MNMRLFIALDLSDEQKEYLSSVQDSFKRRRVSARWVSPAIIHITLQFLGDVDDFSVPNLKAAIGEAVEPFACFAFSLGKLGWFGAAHSPRVLWMQVDKGYRQMIDLQKSIEDKLIPLGFKSDKPFKPHITLARNPELNGLDITQAASEGIVEVGRASTEAVCTKVVLYRSYLAKEGPTYEVLKEFYLK